MRGTVLLPHGTGRTVRVIAFAKGDNAKAAQEAGADIVGDQDLIDRVKAGFTEFDVAVATPDMMASVGKELGRILAQKMPNPKAGTVTPNIAAAIRDIKAGKVEFRPDKSGIIHTIVGKASFDEAHLIENVTTLLDAIMRAKPAAAKGTYLRSVTLASTMGPGREGRSEPGEGRYGLGRFAAFNPRVGGRYSPRCRTLMCTTGGACAPTTVQSTVVPVIRSSTFVPGQCAFTVTP